MTHEQGLTCVCLGVTVCLSVDLWSFVKMALQQDFTCLCVCLQQNRLRWYGHVLRKDDNDWVKKCMQYEVEGARPRGRPKKTWRDIVEKDCQARKVNREDAMDRNRWRKQIRDD